MPLNKARVQLIDQKTNAVIEEVDILTDASAIGYVNDAIVSKDVGAITAGTSFPESAKKTVQDVLDAILYPGNASSVPDILDMEGNVVTEDKVIYIEKFTDVRPHFITLDITAGDRSQLTITMKRNNLIDGTTQNITRTVTVQPGSVYVYQEEVEKISNDTSVQIVVSDGVTVSRSPIIEYRFVYPVFVGYCDLDKFIGDSGVEFNISEASNYFNTLIRNESPMLEKRIVPPCTVQSIALDNPIFDVTRSNPCILFPNATWNKPDNIIDGNGGNIMAAYINGPVPIKPDKTVSSNVQYSAYVNVNKYPVTSAATKAIKYIFGGDGSIDSIGEGVPSLSGFDVLTNLPLDTRSVVENYEDLSTMLYPHDGLITYVKKEHSYFSYNQEKNEWSTTNTKTSIQVTGLEPPIDQGGWDDIVFDLKSGNVYQKNKNISWDIKGRITQGGVVPAWIPDKYKVNSIVLHEDKYWKSTIETEAEPGANYEWKEIQSITE